MADKRNSLLGRSLQQFLAGLHGVFQIAGFAAVHGLPEDGRKLGGVGGLVQGGIGARHRRLVEQIGAGR